MPYWQRQFSTGFRGEKGNLTISASQQSEVVSILSAGTFFGALGAAPIADRIGRRFALIVSSWVFIFGVILQTAATHLPLFVAGRFFAGFGVGLVSALSKYFVFRTS
jgi:predicted MFS family arabinose efflux permease